MTTQQMRGLVTALCSDEPVAHFTHDVIWELVDAREKHPDEEGVLTDAEWLAVLTEEVGECARAIQDEGDDALRAELVQVAAMALRWTISIPLGRQRPPWATQAQLAPWPCACVQPLTSDCLGDCGERGMYCCGRGYTMRPGYLVRCSDCGEQKPT